MPGKYTVQISGYNDAATDYVVRVSVVAPTSPVVCGVPALGASASVNLAGAYHGTNSGTNPDSIILYNRSRFTAKAGGDVQADLEQLADATRGWVVPVTTNVEWNDPSVADQCAAQLANAVSQDVHDALLPLLSSTNPVQNVVVIGTDDILPMRRVQDATGIADERDYANQVGGTTPSRSPWRRSGSSATTSTATPTPSTGSVASSSSPTRP